MPRRAQPPAAATAGSASSSSSMANAVPSLDPITRKLRRSWMFAAVCQFLFVFDEAFGMSGFETESLEKDLAGPESEVVPDLMKRLLYTLTLDRRIDISNWQEHLRLQYLGRDPEHNPLGTLEEPLGWDRLTIEDKLTSLHNLCEWQLQDPERFRKLVKSEEDTTTWRVAPIGWDGADNAYWLFDDNRIWIQRPPPPPPKPAAKPRAPPKKGSKRARTEAAAARRAAAAASNAASAKSTPAKSTPSRSAAATPASGGRSSPHKRGRLSEAESDSGTASPSKRGRGENGKVLSRRPQRRGTRTSARFNKEEDEENSDSELSEPPEEEQDEGQARSAPKSEEATAMDLDDPPAQDQAAAEAEQHAAEEEAKGEEGQLQEAEGEDWIEFETIAVTRADWMAFASRFAKSKDLNERNLHTFVNQHILPTVLAAFDEQDRQRALELALANRKRSSRIALKESEKEERERDREARVRMEEKMARLREEEDEKRAKAEEELKTQKAREDRMREREERILAREREAEDKAVREEMERERREREREERKRRRDEIIANGGVPPSEEATATPEPTSADASAAVADAEAGQGQKEEEGEEENWELNCEVCGKAGINPPDEGKEIVCCETCAVWQHVKCWNKFDKHILGRKKNRNWANEDFYCTKCRPPPDGVPVPTPGMVFRREKASPSVNSVGRTSQDPETPTRSRIGVPSAATPGTSPTRQKIKLVHRQSNEAANPASPDRPDVVADGATLLGAPTFQPKPTVQAAETGVLTSSGAARPSIAAYSPVPTPSSTQPSFVEPSRLPSAQPLPNPNPAEKPTEGSPMAAKPAGASAGPTPSSAAGLPVTPDAKGSMAPPAPRRISSSSQQANATPAPTDPSGSGAEASPANGRGSHTPGGTSISPQVPSSNAAPPRSPSFSGPGASPKYTRPAQPVGSFPIRHTPAKSPLSRPYDSMSFHNGESHGGPPPLPSHSSFSLGPSRAISPTPSRGSAVNSGLSASNKPGDLHGGGNGLGGKITSPFGSAASSSALAPAMVAPIVNGGILSPTSDASPSPAAKGAVVGSVSSKPLFSPSVNATAALPIGGSAGSPRLSTAAGGAGDGPVLTAPATPNKQFGPSEAKSPFGSPFAKVPPPSAGAAAQAFQTLQRGEKYPPPASAIGLGLASSVEDATRGEKPVTAGTAPSPTVLPDTVASLPQAALPAEGAETVAISTPAADAAKLDAAKADEVEPETPKAPAPTPALPAHPPPPPQQQPE